MPSHKIMSATCQTILRRITIQSLYTRNTKVAMARAALCVVLCARGCILYTGQCPPQGTSLEVSLPPYLPSSHAPPFLLSLAPLFPPSSARFLPRLCPSLRPCLRSFLTRSLHQPSLPSSIPAPTLSHIIACSRPPVAPSLPTLPLLPPSLPSSILPRSFRASLPACLPASAVQFNVHRVWCLASCTEPIVSRLARRGTETMAGSRQ